MVQQQIQSNPMKLKLTFQDRLNILGILPEEGKREKLVIAREIKKKVEITSKEADYHELKTLDVSGQLRSSFNNKNKIYDIDFSASEIVFVDLIFDSMSEKEKLPMSCLDLSELFKKSATK